MTLNLLVGLTWQPTENSTRFWYHVRPPKKRELVPVKAGPRILNSKSTSKETLKHWSCWWTPLGCPVHLRKTI